MLIVFLIGKRKEIDSIDYKILDLLFERLETCKDIGEYKKSYNLPITNSKREQELLEDRLNYLAKLGINNKNLVESLYKTIIKESKKLQKKESKK